MEWFCSHILRPFITCYAARTGNEDIASDLEIAQEQLTGIADWIDPFDPLRYRRSISENTIRIDVEWIT